MHLLECADSEDIRGTPTLKISDAPTATLKIGPMLRVTSIIEDVSLIRCDQTISDGVSFIRNYFMLIMA